MAYIQLDGSAQLAYAEVLDNALARGIQTGEGFSFISAKRGFKVLGWDFRVDLITPKTGRGLPLVSCAATGTPPL